eukprot:COSAG01_NODE_19246_length_1022_cov_1.569881_1_plen_123_part_01
MRIHRRRVAREGPGVASDGVGQRRLLVRVLGRGAPLEVRGDGGVARPHLLARSVSICVRTARRRRSVRLNGQQNQSKRGGVPRDACLQRGEAGGQGHSSSCEIIMDARATAPACSGLSGSRRR